MEISSGLNDLRTSIIEALKNATVEKEYPKWLYDCREKYGISSYTLQLLIDFYQKQLNETEVVVPSSLSNNFVSYVSPSVKDDFICSERGDNENIEKAKKKYSFPFLLFLTGIFLLIIVLFCSVISKSSEYERIVSEKISKEHDLKKYIDKCDSLESNYHICRKLWGAEHIIGASRVNSTKNYDANYVMWLNVKHSLKINSFCVMANANGNIEVGLYDEQSQLISSFSANVLNGKFKRLYPRDFLIKKPGAYYLAIVKNKGMALSYHRSTSVEYEHFKDGVLEITGCSPKGNNSKAARTSQDWYEYFYDISYNLIDLM